MIKKILYVALVIVIVVGAGYSYKKVDFGRKTTMFLKMNFGARTEVFHIPPFLPMGCARRGLQSSALWGSIISSILLPFIPPRELTSSTAKSMPSLASAPR